MERCRKDNEGSLGLGGKLIMNGILRECDVCRFVGVKVVSGGLFWNQLLTL
jgi:hypothetical protein